MSPNIRPLKGFDLKISEIKAGMDGITVTGRIIHIENIRTVQTRYGPAHVALATMEDDTGSITLNLWRDQIDMVLEGDVIRVERGFVRTFGNRLELNVGSRGKIEVVSRTKL